MAKDGGGPPRLSDKQPAQIRFLVAAPREAMDHLRTLVLSPWMGVHRIVDWKEAISIVWAQKGEALETYEATASSPSVTLQIPAVVRLKKAISPFKKGVKFSRGNILSRDGFRCCYCGEKFEPRKLNYDHVVPRHQGGKTDWDNIVSSCYPCNRKKRNRTPQQAGMKMHFKPHKPKVLPMARPLVSVRDVPSQWLPYIEAAQETG